MLWQQQQSARKHTARTWLYAKTAMTAMHVGTARTHIQRKTRFMICSGMVSTLDFLLGFA